MAAEVSSMPVNGNYAAHQYNGDHHQQQHPGNGQFNAQQPPYQPAASSNNTATATPASSQGAETSAVPKDEVGWFFVEQYYTTLSKSPDKLYLYYNKRSQFVHGNETDKVEVCVGQRAINDRMKDLDFEDCKVRITNVDSQASDQNIVIQVIGEISNKSQPHRKFTQTFVLATQTNGYFVLNDIFRFLIEEEDEAVPQDEAAPAVEESSAASAAQGASEPTAAVEAEKPKTLTSSTDPTAIEQDAQKVDKTIESKLLSPETNGVEEKTAPKVEVSDSPERPTEPEPTPAASPPKQTPAQPAATSAPKPVIPKTWASLAASANKGPGAKAAAPAAQAQAQRASPVKPAVAPPTGPAAAKEAATAPAPSREETQAGETDEWTAVGGNHNRQQSRQVNGQQHQQHQPRPQPEGPQRRGFIKNVNESVTMPALREALEKIAKVVDLDISHAKNCAFVEFETPEGYNAVVAANPITVGSEQLYVEERKVRAANGGFVPRGQFQGGRGGRGDFRGGRGGNTQQRGRGGQGGASRGTRGGAQQQP